jgi:hypothetical protein
VIEQKATETTEKIARDCSVCFFHLFPPCQEATMHSLFFQAFELTRDVIGAAIEDVRVR